MDDAERAARVAELEREQKTLVADCQRLADELHQKRNTLQTVTLRLALLQRGHSFRD